MLKDSDHVFGRGWWRERDSLYSCGWSKLQRSDLIRLDKIWRPDLCSLLHLQGCRVLCCGIIKWLLDCHVGSKTRNNWLVTKRGYEYWIYWGRWQYSANVGGECKCLDSFAMCSSMMTSLPDTVLNPKRVLPKKLFRAVVNLGTNSSQDKRSFAKGFVLLDTAAPQSTGQGISW